MEVARALGSSQMPSQQSLPAPLADRLPHIIVRYAVGVHSGCAANASAEGPGSAGGKAGTADNQPYPAEAFLALLAAAPVLLSQFLSELAACANAAHLQSFSEQKGRQHILEATQISCEVFGDVRLHKSLLSLQNEAGDLVTMLREALSLLDAASSSKLQVIYTTLYGLPLSVTS